MKLLFPILAVIGGLAVGLQATINGGLGKKVGTIETSFISFTIGTLALLFMVIFFGKGNIMAVGDVPKWQLTGGLLGALYVFIMVLVVPKLGVASSLMAVIAGQLIMGAILDHFGLLGGRQIPFDSKRMIAIGLFFVAIYLFYRK
ncbi:DMT family transporter [Cytobacillus sp. FJAT-54145]|uniref:DMT family transporter n=1 Tax=Cytobacillus spartinae TaxID=3299023 RepID=A0ABW6KF64_9BACI